MERERESVDEDKEKVTRGEGEGGREGGRDIRNHRRRVGSRGRRGADTHDRRRERDSEPRVSRGPGVSATERGRKR